MIQSFGQIFEIIDGDRGKNYPQDKDFSESGYCLFLSAANVTKDGWRFDSNQFITKKKCDILRKGLISRGDIVFTTRGTVGNVAFYDDTIPYETVRINSGMIILRGKGADIISNKFAYYILKSKFVGKLITYYCSGSAQPQLPIKDFSKIKVDLPALDIQKKIVSILSNYDSLIDINTKRIKLLEESARELYKEWFVRMRFPGHEKIKYVKGIPDGWKVAELKELVTTQYGLTTTTHPQKEKGNDAYYLRITDIVDNNINWTQVPYCSTDDDVMRKYKLCQGDILVARIGATVGYATQIQKIPYEAVFASYLIRLKAKNKLYISYIGMSVVSDIFRDHIQSIATGAAQPMANPHLMASFKLLLPSEHLLKQFNVYIDSVNDIILHLQLQNQNLAATRDRLLPRLLSGELKVKA